MRIIKAKLKGKKIDLEPEVEPRQAEVVDLMERLRRSLAQNTSGSGRGGGAKKRPVKAGRQAGARKKHAA
jgi:non-homologous end joining protein Ku